MQNKKFLTALVAVLGACSLSTASAAAAPEAGNTGLSINNSGRIEILSSTPIDYRNLSVANGRRRVSLRTNAVLLCADFATPPGAGINRVGLDLTDPNGDSVITLQAQTIPPTLIFGGITGFEYFTNGASPSILAVSSDAQLACCVRLGQSNATCVQGPNGGETGPALFSDGFEPSSAIPGDGRGNITSNLAVAINAPATSTPGANYSYIVTVFNNGGTALNNVRVRDWYPKQTGGFSAWLTSGSVNCAASPGASCGAVNGSGNIIANDVSLVPGASVQFTINRQMAAGAGEGSPFTVAAAAFAPPDANESALANNYAVRNGTIQTNAPPVLNTISAPETILEDTSTAPIAIVANDPDSVLTPASFSCTGALVTAGSCQFTGTEPNFSLVVTPRLHANGSSPVTVTVSDGSSSDSKQFTLTVTPVNDPPEFTLATLDPHPPGTTGIRQITNFVTQIRPGPLTATDEAGQTFIERSVTVLSGGSIFETNGDPIINYGGSPESGTLLYVLNGSAGTATVRVRMQDNGGTANGGNDTTDQTFTITVQSPSN